MRIHLVGRPRCPEIPDTDIFHLGAYDEDYSAYHSPTDTFDNMIAEVGGPDELKKIQICLVGCLFRVRIGRPNARS